MRAWIRAQGILAAGIGIAIAGCGDSEQKSDLNTSGPPRVITVTVRSEQAVLDGVPRGEAPSFCSAREGDYGAEKLHAVCLDALDAGEDLAPVTDAVPFPWQVRLVFNELLDADQVETIVGGRGSLATTQPVIVRCGDEEVSYDGYYDPSGSHLTNPPGPSLVVHLPLEGDKPLAEEAVPTSSACEIEIKAEVMGKDGEQVLASARGPFSFGIAPLSVVGTDPSDEAEGVGIDRQLKVKFNAPIDIASLSGAEPGPVDDKITLAPEGGEPVAATFSLQEDEPETTADEEDVTTVVITPEAELAPDTVYSIAVLSDIADVKGGTLDVGADPLVIATFRTQAEAQLVDAGVDAAAADAAP